MMGRNVLSAGLGARASGIALALMTFAASAQTFAVPAELWDRPRSGGAVMERLALKQAATAWLAQPAARMLIHHGPGQEALLQAEELRSWLIALAVEADSIMLRNDLNASEPLRLEVLRD